MRVISSVILGLLLTACSSTEVQKSNTEKDASSVSSKVEIVNQKPVSLEAFRDKTFTLHSVDGYKDENYKNVNVVFTNTDSLGNIVRGNAGCNRYFAKYETVRSLLVTSEIVATKMMCSGAQMQLENFMFKIYSQRPVISFNNDEMIFETPTNKLIFKKDKNILNQ